MLLVWIKQKLALVREEGVFQELLLLCLHINI